MKILGIGPSMVHDPAAALIIDGEVIAAAEEERFLKEKHADNKLPLNAVRYCLDYAGLKPQNIDIVAFAWSPLIYNRLKFQYLKRKFFYSPDRALKAVVKATKIAREKADIVKMTCQESELDYSPQKVKFIEHHIAHAASAYYPSGFNEASILSIDGSGEFTATLLAKGTGREITKIKEICVPDSLGLFYSTFTEYLGFKSNNGEYKLMGMAPYGDPSKFDFGDIIRWNNRKKSYICNDNHVWVKRKDRFNPSEMYSKLFVNRFGYPRQGDGLSQPYIHIAAATQGKFEEMTLKLVDTYLRQDLLEHGNLCFAGGCALNVALNRVLLQLPYVKNLWVQPAAHDAGTSLGAALYAAVSLGENIKPMKHIYLGPEFSNREIEVELAKSGFSFTLENDICETVAFLLLHREIVGWFQGRMEWGPRALGNRSILGNPTVKGTADKINAQIKFREKWRPFCPSILKEHASQILGSTHPAPFMTIAFDVNPQWLKRIPEVVHVNGTCRPQVVEEDVNPRFYKVIENFYKKTGVPVVINTSLNRRGEPIVCTPRDALNMFKGSGLEHLAMGDFLVTKTPNLTK